MSTIEIQFDKRIDNSRIMRETDARHRIEYVGLTLLGALFVLGVLFYAWQQYQWIQYGYRIEEAQKKIEELVEVGRQLKVERATQANPQRIDSMARWELGMVSPEVGQVVTLRGTPELDAGPETLVAQSARSASRR